MRIFRGSHLPYVLGAVFLWSTVATAFNLTLRGMNFVQLLFYAAASSSLVLSVLGLCGARRQMYTLIAPRYLLRNWALGFLNPFLYYLVLFKAYSLLPAQEAQPLNYTWPLATAFFARIFLGQRISSRTMVGMFFAFVGVWIISTRGAVCDMRFHCPFGVILAVGSSLLWAGYWTLNLVDPRSISIKLWCGFVYGTVFAAIYLALTGSFYIADYRYLGGAVYVGCFEMGFTFWLWMKGLESSPDKGKTATWAYLSPFISLFFIAGIVGEKILPSSLLGLVLIVAGIVYQRTTSHEPRVS